MRKSNCMVMNLQCARLPYIPSTDFQEALLGGMPPSSDDKYFYRGKILPYIILAVHR